MSNKKKLFSDLYLIKFLDGLAKIVLCMYFCDIFGAWYICNIENFLYVASYNITQISYWIRRCVWMCLYIMYASIIDVAFITLSYMNVDAKVRA